MIELLDARRLLFAAGDEVTPAGLPILHSLPSAPAAIYLDFDGQGTRDSYSEDADGTTFNAAEQGTITNAWELVSTYFAMFNVDVTTVKPTVPFAWHVTTPDQSGGVSTVGSFPDTSPQSFNNSSDARDRVTGIAHEIGHNFGLVHQSEYDGLGELTSEYTDGFDAQHGALMGSDPARNVHKWFIGHDTGSDGAYTLQDDIAKIANKLKVYGGDGFRPDDHASGTAAATSLISSGGSYIGAGILERRTDVDTFSFTTTGGTFLIAANRAIESAVDVKIEIYDAAGALVAAEDSSANDAEITATLASGTYSVSVSSHGNYGDLGMYDVTVNPMRAGFDARDVGFSKRAGTTSYSASTGTWTLTAAGDEIGGTADEFRFAYQELRGDGSITARVNTISNVNSGALGGVMIRESLATGSKFAMASHSPGGVDNFRRRTGNSGASATAVDTSVSNVSSPFWVRLTRVGNVFTAFRSIDGSAWTSIGSATISMSSSVLIGMAVNSHAATKIASSTFTGVAFTGDVGPETYAVSASLAAPGSVSVTQGAGTSLNIGWSAVAGATGYILQRSTDGTIYDDIATYSSGTLAATDPNLAGAYRYFYRVVATEAAGRSSPSAAASAYNRPSAVTNLKTMSLSETRVVVDWRDTVGESGYRVERSADGGGTWTVLSASVGVNVPSFIDDGVTANGVYLYRVTPLSPAGDGLSATVSEGARLSAVGGLTLTAITQSTATLSWSDLGTVETGYRIERSTDKSTWSAIAALGDVTGYTDSGLSAVNEYYYRVVAISGLTESSGPSNVAFGATPAINPLPSPWQATTVGSVPARSSAAGQSGGTFTTINASADIGGTNDAFTFTYQRVSGDVDLIARVNSIDAGVAGSEAGLMFRTSLTANSPFAMAAITSDAGSRFISRAATGTTATTTAGPVRSDGAIADAPYWLRLRRVDGITTAMQSADGVTWVTVSTSSASFGGLLYVGLAVSSHSNVEMTTAKFSSVSVVADPADTVPPGAPVVIGISEDRGFSSVDRITTDATLLFTGTAEPGATITVKQGTTTLGSTIATAGGAWIFDYTTTTLADGAHAFSVTATDSAGNASAATTFSVTIDRVAPTVASGVFDRETGHQWRVTFSEDVGGSLATGDVVLVNRGTGEVFVPVLNYNPASRTITARLAGDARLGDGNYLLTLAAGVVSDVAGNANTVAYSLPFRVYAGDLNDDGAVNFADLVILAQGYNTTGRTYSQGNIDYDPSGTVGFADLVILAQKYNTSIAAVPAVQAIAAPTKRRAAVAGVVA